MEVQSKSLHEIKDNFHEGSRRLLIRKNVYLVIISNILLAIGIALLYLGFKKNNTNFLSGEHINLNQRENFHYGSFHLRGFGLYIIGIFLGLSIKEFHNLMDLRKYDVSMLRNLYILIPGINFWYVLKNARPIAEFSIGDVLSRNFALEERSCFNRRFNLKYNCILVLAIVNLLSIFFAMLPTRAFNLDIIWFKSLSFYTIQTNVLLCITMWIYIAQPRLKIFKNNNWLIVLATYIFVVSIVYSISIPFLNFTKKYADNYRMVKTCFYHFINPFLFCSLAIFLMIKYKSKNERFFDILRRASILPTIYLLYLISLPFVSGVSVYGRITNGNPHLLWIGPDKSFPGTYMVFLLIPCLVLFFTFAFYSFYKINSIGRTRYAICYQDNNFAYIKNNKR